jgi:ketopantoate reductase
VTDKSTILLGYAGAAAAGIGVRPSFYRWMPAVLHVLDWLNPLLQMALWLYQASGRDLDHTSHASMWEDLQLNRRTEIHYLNGEIMQLGRAHGIPTPANTALRNLVEEAERSSAGLPNLSAERLLTAIMEERGRACGPTAQRRA